MKILKKDIENLSDSSASTISWQYEHLEDKDYIGNHFDAIITYNIKDKWATVHLLRYGGNKPIWVCVEKFWFIRNVEHLEEDFIRKDSLDEKIFEKMKEDFMKEYFVFNDFSESANALKQAIEQQKKSNESQTTDKEIE